MLARVVIAGSAQRDEAISAKPRSAQRDEAIFATPGVPQGCAGVPITDSMVAVGATASTHRQPASDVLLAMLWQHELINRRRNLIDLSQQIVGFEQA